jgi:ribosomal protein S18 acetylase RimI-like enzyme
MDAAWNYRGKNFVILHRLCVKAERQNEGIGTKTMIEIERRVKNTGIQAIRLDTFSQNPFALNMYKKLGYKKTGQAHWRKGLFYLFEKQL